MSKKRGWSPIELPGAATSAGAYSRGVQAGPFVFVSGQVPRDPATGQVVGTDVPTQTARVLENIRLILREGGLTLDDVVSVTVYLADIADWDAFNAVFRETFTPPFPTRTVVGAQLHGVLVEANAIAFKGMP